MVLDIKARREGHKAMEQSISAASRVRRQLKAGRPRTVRDLSLNSFEAMGRIVNEADRAQGLMHEAGLDPGDIRLGLIICTSSGVLCKPLPAPEKTKPFFDGVARMTDARFLGILWEQTDREAEATGQPGKVYWITPFVADPDGQRMMLALRDTIRDGGKGLRAN